MDAVPFVISSKGAKVTKPEEDYGMLRTFSQFLSWREGDAIILGEANVLPDTDMRYFGTAGERMQMMFNFDVNQHLFLAMATADSRPLKKAMLSTKRRPADTGQRGQFLRNHDELDLGRLEVKQRNAVFAAFGPDPEWSSDNRGIRRCLAPMLEGDRRRLELAYSLMMTLPWHSRYSLRRTEPGLGDNLKLPERNCARTPMQWSTEPNAGFTKSDKPIAAGNQLWPLRFRARQRRCAATRSRLITGLDGAHHSQCVRKCPR